MLDTTIATLQAALDEAAALFLEEVLYHVRRGLPMDAAALTASGNMRGRDLLAKATRTGWQGSWLATGAEIIKLLKQRHRGFAVEQFAEEPTANPYQTPRPLNLPDNWREYSAGQRRATWEWLAEHEATLQRVLPTAYIDRYVQQRIPPLAGIADRHLLEAARDVAAGVAERGFGVKESMAALRQELPGLTRWRLENIARTEGAVLYETGRLARMREDAAVTGVRYDAVGDSRTTEICKGLDGRCWKLDDPAIVVPPTHFMCRSTHAPILFDEEPQWQDGQALPEKARPLTGFGKIDEGLLPGNVTL